MKFWESGAASDGGKAFEKPSPQSHDLRGYENRMPSTAEMLAMVRSLPPISSVRPCLNFRSLEYSPTVGLF